VPTLKDNHEVGRSMWTLYCARPIPRDTCILRGVLSHYLSRRTSVGIDAVPVHAFEVKRRVKVAMSARANDVVVSAVHRILARLKDRGGY
jgi:hypothetical protein